MYASRGVKLIAEFVEDPSRPDIIEESLDLFRANCLFRNFEIKGASR